VRKTPFLVIPWPLEDTKPLESILDTFALFVAGGAGDTCRGVSLDRLSAILANGCDVEPTDAPIFTGYLDKAFEYGDWPKVIQVFHATSLERSFIEIRADLSDPVASEATKDYPTRIVSEDGEWFWCSRLEASDRRAGSAYEEAHGKWIPGDAWEALAACFIIARGSEEWIAVRNVLAQALPQADLALATDPLQTEARPDRE
jgi:hypothetical protein